MKRFLSTCAVLTVAALALTACNTPGERAVAGGALGAGAGALAGQAIGRNTGATVAGAVIGGVAGAMIGHGTAPGECQFHQQDSRGRPMYDRNGRPVTFLAPCR